MASAAYFDSTSCAWVLSRYADVVAALRERRLWPLTLPGKDPAKIRDAAGRLRLRPDIQEVLSASQVAAWQAEMEVRAAAAAQLLPTDGAVDLLAGFAQPWCLELALLVLGAPPGDRAHLAELGERVFAGTGAPEDSPLRADGAAATAELECLFEAGPVPMGEPTFVALSQTLPRLLASSWIALCQHPSEWQTLRARPGLLAGAAEELLRYAGIVRRIWREAIAPLELAGVSIADGQRVMLMLAAANRDPAQFPDPERLDVTREITGQVALGTGRNSCVGGVLVRMGLTVATGALLSNFTAIELSTTPEWRTGSGYCFPAAAPVHLHRADIR